MPPLSIPVPLYCHTRDLISIIMFFREGNDTPHQYSFAWKIPWMEEPGRLQSMGSLRVRYNWATSLSLFTFVHWRRQWQPTPVLLPGESHGRRSLVGCSPRGRKDSDTTERLPFHFSLSCIGEGNGNSLQCSCLENPRDGGAWWAAVYGVAQSWTWLKWLSSSSLVYIMANSHRGFQKQNACAKVNICYLCKQISENDQKIYNTDDSWGNKVEEEEKE